MREYYLDEISELKIYGRTSEVRRPLTLFWTGSGIEVNLKASELWIQFHTDYDGNEQWICILINHFPVSRRMLAKGSEKICIFRGMNQENVTNVRIIKEVQPVSGDNHELFQIEKLETDGVFTEVEEKKCRIEFIGDSITAGEGAVGSQGEEDWIPMWFSGVRNYTYLIAERMNADYRILAQSGWGVHCGWDNNINSNMPSCYEQICGLAKGEENRLLHATDRNDFSSWQPDMIVINLGTNDEAAFKQGPWTDELTGKSYQMKMVNHEFCQEDIGLFKDDVISFLKLVRRNNPKAFILWVYGMLGYSMEIPIQEAIAEYSRQEYDENVEFLLLKDTEEKDYGARFHPGITAHENAAQRIVSKLIGG